MRHFSIEGSSIQSKKLVAVLSELALNNCQALQTLQLTDLSVPLKKSSAGAICALINSLSTAKAKLTLERIPATEAVVNGLLKSLIKVKQLDLNEMALTAAHIEAMPKLLECTGGRRVQVLNLRHNQLGIDGAMAIA